MKVCYFSCTTDLSGTDRSLIDLLFSLDRNEVEPFVILPCHCPIEDELQKLKIPYHIIPNYFSTKGANPLKSMIKYFINLGSAFAISLFVRRNHIDIMHINCFLSDVGMMAAKQAKVPYICHLRELVQEDHGMDFIIPEKQYRLLQQANFAIAISDFVYQKYMRVAPDQKFGTIFDTINVHNYLNEQKKIFNDNKTINILMVGRVAPGKGQMEAVQAIECLRLKGVKNVEFKIVGIVENDYFNEVKAYVSSHKITQVEFIPFVNDNQVLRDFRAKSDINLICSRAEAMGRVTIESQLAGCLTIGADAGATPELIQHGETGLLYEVGRPEDLADKIIYAIEHVEEMRRIAKQGQEYAKKTYDCNTYGQKILEIYQQVLQQR